MFNCTCLVRFQSDAADRSIDRAMQIDSEHTERHSVRRGVCEVNIGFDDPAMDRRGEAVGSTRKRALARMLLARYAEPGYTYRVRFGSYEEIVYLSKEMKERYEDYQILFRVSGSTFGSRSVVEERKYSIEDVLFGYVFKTVEELEQAGRYRGKGRKHWVGRYRFNYDNVWRVERCDSSQRPMDLDICAVDGANDALKCFEQVSGARGLFADSDRGVSPTTVIRPVFEKPPEEVAKVIYSIMSKVHGSLDNKDTYVISPLEKVEKKLKEGMFAFLAVDMTDSSEDSNVLGLKGKVVGFATFQKPLDPADNYGYDIGLSEDEAKQVLMVDSVAVLPKYRGQSLQKRFLALGEEVGAWKDCRIFIATVDPRNSYSLNNFIYAGYKRVKLVYAYKGRPREILVKRHRDSFGKSPVDSLPQQNSSKSK